MKKRANAGFSLAETLLAIMILLLVSVIVATGVPAATSAFERVIIGSNAKVLLSTAISSLRDEIATARTVEVKDNVITYFSSNNGATSRIFVNDNKDIILDEYIDSELQAAKDAKHITSMERLLVSAKAATRGLFVTYETATAAGNAVVINNLKVRRRINETVSDPFAQVEELKIRIIKPIPTGS